MPTIVDLFLPLSDLPDPTVRPAVSDPLTSIAVRRAAELAGVPAQQLSSGRIVRRSLDARKGFPVGFALQVELCRPGELPPAQEQQRLPPPRPARPGLRVAVVGSGPAGTFAALRLSRAGAQVTVIEQGRQVQPRRRDLALLTRGQLQPSSNYCFGEGGAGTYSDGKLYTRTKDRVGVAEVLATLRDHGADPGILVESRPHIGSNRLPQILTALREDLCAGGVAYHFCETVTDFLFSTGRGRVAGVVCASGREVRADAVVLAVGHSARPMYRLLHDRCVPLVARPFAVGVRVEHPQPLIDELQYGRAAGHPALPAAFYHLTAQCAGRGVYTFCMCPGGWIVPSSTEPDGLCVNGMSLKRRDSPFANSAVVVTVEPADYGAFAEPGTPPALHGVDFQRALERRAFAVGAAAGPGGGDFTAPAQTLDELCADRRRSSRDRPLRSTYRPAVAPADLGQVLPAFVLSSLRDGLRRFQRTLPGYLTSAAQAIGVETRTSAPVRVLRGADYQSPGLQGLYPCGEGAGYAGGIVSAAIDGLRVADAILVG